MLITIPNQRSIDWNSTDSLPECRYFNTTIEEYDGEGCYALSRTSEYTICACLHSTYFGVGTDDFKVESNAIDLSKFRDFTWKQFKKNPIGLIVAICIILACLFMMFTIPKIDDKPLIAHKRSVEKKYIQDSTKFVAYKHT